MKQSERETKTPAFRDRYNRLTLADFAGHPEMIEAQRAADEAEGTTCAP